MATKQKREKVVLAYSGGLDTSVAVKWLQVEHGLDVIACCVDVGQNDNLEIARKKALQIGAVKAVVVDARERFCRDYLTPAIMANAVYEGRYVHSTSLNRPMISEVLVEVARKEGATYFSHGATAKGNDQVRFEVTAMALNPTLKVIAPWREWDIRSREDAIAYAQAHGVPVTQTTKSIYSRDANIWHMSHEGGPLEDPWHAPDEDVYKLSTSPEQAPDEPEEVEIEFESGVPVGLDGKRLGPVELVDRLNELGGRHAIGRIDLVENRLVGMKSRGVYETPGGTLLYTAHQELEGICLDKNTLHFKQMVALRYAELVYDGLWFSSLREALDGFVLVTQRHVTGQVRLKLYKGNIIVMGRQSPYSLYREDYASFGMSDVYDQQDAEGFIQLWGLPLKVDAMLSIAGTGQSRFRAPDYSIFKRD